MNADELMEELRRNEAAIRRAGGNQEQVSRLTREREQMMRELRNLQSRGN